MSCLYLKRNQDQEHPPEKMWVGWVGWSQTFVNRCFYDIFDQYISLKVHFFVPNLPKSLGWVGHIGREGDLKGKETLFDMLAHIIVQNGLFSMEHVCFLRKLISKSQCEAK